MNPIMQNVLNQKETIMEETMRFQRIISKGPYEYSQMARYFDTNFSPEEIMVVQAIMYFGRECYIGDASEYKGTAEDVINRWMYELRFSFGDDINKDVEIFQMVEKSLAVGTYFDEGFKELARR